MWGPVGGGALGACEQERGGSVPGEVRHSLGGAKLTLSPSPSAASKEPRLRHAAASAAARAQLHHAHTHTHTLTICMYPCMCARRVHVWATQECSNVFSSFALWNSLPEMPFHPQRQTIGLKRCRIRGGKGKCKCVRCVHCVRADGPLRRASSSLAFHPGPHTRSKPDDK